MTLACDDEQIQAHEAGILVLYLAASSAVMIKISVRYLRCDSCLWWWADSSSRSWNPSSIFGSWFSCDDLEIFYVTLACDDEPIQAHEAGILVRYLAAGSAVMIKISSMWLLLVMMSRFKLTKLEFGYLSAGSATIYFVCSPFGWSFCWGIPCISAGSAGIF